MSMLLRILAAIALLALGPPAHAQTAKNKAALQAEINSSFPDNTVGQITPAIARAAFSDFLASWQQYTGVNPQTGVTYTFLASDYGQLVTFNNASSIAVALPNPSTTGFNPWNTYVRNIGAGTVTITPAGANINGASTLVLTQNQSASIVSDGTNYQTWTNSASPGTPSFPVVHPSSGNLVGAGCATPHQLWWVDQNLCSTADVWVLKSNDPSALFSAIIGGSITAGDRVRLTFTFAGACVAGCNVDYTTAGGDTTTTVTAGLSCAIANNPTLFNLNGGTCSAGTITPATGQTYGGYATGKEVGYVVSAATTLALNYNAGTPIKVVATVNGSATETVTIQQSNCGTVCDISLDNNPSIITARDAGIAPPAGSIISNWQVNGAESAHIACCTVTYGQINHYVENSTTGSLAARWCMSTVNTDNTLACRIFAGRGFYTAGVTDKGVDTVNTKQFWVNSAYEIYQSSGLIIDTLATNDVIQLMGTGNATSGVPKVGIGGIPTGVLDVSGPISSFSTAGPPTVGAGVTLEGGATPTIFFFNWGTSAYLNGQFLGLSWDFRPSNSSTSGWTLSANKLAPDADNVTQIGDGTHNASNIFATLVTTPGCVFGGTNSSARCSSALTTEPQFQITNTTTDAQSGFFIMQKSRTGTNTLASDHLFQFQFQGFATSFSASAGIDILQTGASSGANIPSKILLQTSNAAGQLNQNFVFDSAAHVSTVQASAPTLTAGCNGAGSSVSGTDTYGTVTGQTAAATTCTLTFGTAFSAAPACTVTGITSAILTITPATGTLVATFASTATYKFTYICHGA